MATIKPIESRSIHQIQSGQVIVDLNSVVKELVENSLDAAASSIEVRFKNYGLDAIEVQDNGNGIAPQDFESIALKHYTSKLASFDDISSLQTFGFRGEAISSLCALSAFHIVTARANDAPKGSRLDFDVSGKLKGTTIVAAQKGTVVVVEELFRNLPVRRKELEKNIKREYTKVIQLLHQYACISTKVKFSVSNQLSKGKKTVAFVTQANDTTRENIANVYGAKTLSALVPLDLALHLEPTMAPLTQKHESSRVVRMLGHISRPVFGEGRQAPDRQMFFVNSRPCLLPQIAKAVNEVYRSFNVSQSPFVCANLLMDTNAYDVNVSPDKRTILLHDQTALLEELKEELEKMFQVQDQTVPQARKPGLPNSKLPAFRSLTLPETMLNEGAQTQNELEESGSEDSPGQNSVQLPPRPGDAKDNVQSEDEETLFINSPTDVFRRFVTKDTEERQPFRRKITETGKSVSSMNVGADQANALPGFRSAASLVNGKPPTSIVGDEGNGSVLEVREMRDVETTPLREPPRHASDRTPITVSEPCQPSQNAPIPAIQTAPIRVTPGPVQNAFDRMRMGRTPATTAIITIGDMTTVADIGSAKRRKIHTPKFDLNGQRLSQVSPSLRRGLSRFAAGGVSSSQPESAPEDSAEESSGAENESGDPQLVFSAGQRATCNSGTNTTALTDGEEKQSEPETEGSDGEYIDEGQKKSLEEARIAKLIAKAEAEASRPSQDNLKRAQSVLSGRMRRQATYQLSTELDTMTLDLESLQSDLARLRFSESETAPTQSDAVDSKSSAGEQITLTVSKQDFLKMRIAGQFNLGFILAVRRSEESMSGEAMSTQQSLADELFIIDQHASDEKYNFERLQNETIVQNQKLVQSKVLDLTAVEEEIILNNGDALLKNGFVIDVDESGRSPTGQRCRLVSLPMSKEVVFDTRDLEELLALLSENAGSGVPRPSKVRRMFAMRACRGSIMVGKTLTLGQMEKVVRHMGQIDKPWNCPHGRPTMRHVFGLQDWKSWDEGDGPDDSTNFKSRQDAWAEFIRASDETE